MEPAGLPGVTCAFVRQEGGGGLCAIRFVLALVMVSLPSARGNALEARDGLL